MSSFGRMVGELDLDYSGFVRGLANSRNEMQGWQSYTVRLNAAAGAQAGRSMSQASVAAVAVTRNSSAGLGSMLGGLVRFGVSVASVYGNWKLHSIKMKNELLQNQLLLRMMASGPAGSGGGGLMWLRLMTGGIQQNRRGFGSLVQSVMLTAGALGVMGAAAGAAFGTWRAQSAKARTELLQQRLIMQQIRAMRPGITSAVTGGPGVGQIAGGVLMGGLMGRAIGAMASVPGEALGLASRGEQSQIAFEVMLGNAAKARSMLRDLKGYADKSPFDVQGVNEAAQKLLNYNVQAQDVLPTMKMLGDVAAGDMEKFDRLATAFGQMTASGRLMGQDNLQFINAGFNPLQEIAKKTGESMAALKKRMEDGGVSAYEVQQAFVAATSAGGRFHQMTERQSGTMAGLWSTFKDSVSTSLREIGEVLITSLDLKGWLQYLTAAMNQAPFVIRNAGTLLQVELLGWGAYFAETIPGAEDAFKTIAAIMYATWESAKASFQALIADVTAGFNRLAKLAQAASELQTNPGKAAGRMAGIITGLAAERKPGAAPSFAKQFSERFTSALQESSDANFGVNLASKWRQRQMELRWGLAEQSEEAQVEMGGTPGASFNRGQQGKAAKTKKVKADRADSQAALLGSREAARIFTAGLAGTEANSAKEQVKNGKEQIELQTDMAASLRAIVRGATSVHPLLAGEV